VIPRHDETLWKVRIDASPERGKANRALVRSLAETLGVERSRIGIILGTTARDKVIEVEDAGQSEIEQALAVAAQHW
jgi:hypothetical protein